jgi:6-phosphogluconolactonase
MKSMETFASILAMARFCRQWLNDALSSLPAGRFFNIALSGGSTPAALFDALVALEKDAVSAGQPGLPWQTIRFFWGDERCVSPEDLDSNYRMTKVHLFDPLGISSDQVHRIRGENDPVREVKRYRDLLQTMLPLTGGFPCFDLVVLGLGDDGHTASIFPGNEALFNTSQWCAAVVHPVTGQARVTLTGSLINRASAVAFLVTGAGKASIIATIRHQLASRGTGGSNETATLPAALVAPVDGRLCWLLDEAAAAGLQVES